jgi:hypothetical protein
MKAKVTPPVSSEAATAVTARAEGLPPETSTVPTAAHSPPPGWAALAQAARTLSYQLLFTAVAVVAGFAYSLLLPFEYTQRLSFTNWDYLGPRLGAFSVAYGLSFGAVVTLQVYAANQLARRSRGRGVTATLGVLASLASCLACCSPLVPSFLAVLGVSGISLLTTSAPIERFVGTEQNLLLGGGLLTLVLTAAWGARRVVRASCLVKAGSCPADAVGTVQG